MIQGVGDTWVRSSDVWHFVPGESDCDNLAVSAKCRAQLKYDNITLVHGKKPEKLEDKVCEKCRALFEKGSDL